MYAPSAAVATATAIGRVLILEECLLYDMAGIFADRLGPTAASKYSHPLYRLVCLRVSDARRDRSVNAYDFEADRT